MYNINHALINKSGTVTKATYRTMGSYDFVAMIFSVLTITVFITLRKRKNVSFYPLNKQQTKWLRT